MKLTWSGIWSGLTRALLGEDGKSRHLKIAYANGYAAGRGYQGGVVSEKLRDWLTAHMSGDMAIGSSWEEITQRARDLVRNEPWAFQAVQRIVENVIGPEGILCEAEIENPDGTLDDEAGAEIDLWFNRWAADEADAEQEMDFGEMQSVAMAQAPEVGEAFLVEVADPNPRWIVPLCYQVFEPEQLNCTIDGRPPQGNPDNQVKRGIEFDRFGRRAAYYFYTAHPYDLIVTSMDTVRVPAARVIHYYEKRRPSQTRGITWFAPILQTLRDLSKYIGSEMSSAEMGARFAVAIKRAAGAGSGVGFADPIGENTDSDGNSLEYLGFPIIADMGKDDAIEQVQANRPNPQADGWIKLILHSMANGIGLTYLGLTGDTAQASFSSSRFAHGKDKVFYRTLQGRFGRRVVLRIRQRVVSQLAAMGRLRTLSASQFRANPYRWLGTRLLPPGWEEIQAGEEVTAAIERIQAGLSTLQEECSGRGKNYRRVLKQREREIRMVTGLGLDLTTNYPGRVAVTEPAAGPAAAEEANPNA